MQGDFFKIQQMIAHFVAFFVYFLRRGHILSREANRMEKRNKEEKREDMKLKRPLLVSWPREKRMRLTHRLNH